MFTQEGYERLQKEIANASVEELVADLDSQVGKDARFSVDFVVDSLIMKALIERGVDVSAIYDGTTISFDKHIKLSDDKTKIVTI